MTEKTRGICLFCYNNNQLDYAKYAHIAAAMVKRFMKNNNTCLITDNGTLGWIENSIPAAVTERCFDEIVVYDVEHDENPRKHYDSPWTEFTAPFKNSNKHEVIDLTPFDQTLLMDTDFMVQNNFYDYVFDTDHGVALHKHARYLEHQRPYLNEINLNEHGIHHWWSTVVYFDRTNAESQIFFDIWSHVKDNWDYYQLLYQFPKKLFRTDFCVSIAAHMMNGFNNNEFVHDFKGTPLFNMDQKDDIVEIKALDDWLLLAHDRKEPWKNILTRPSKTNIHAMNKRSLGRNADRLFELLELDINK